MFCRFINRNNHFFRSFLYFRGKTSIKLNRYIFTAEIVILLILLVSSCDKFEGDQTIPAYIHVDSIRLVDNPLLEEGNLTKNIQDVWAYVDDDLVGAFELPATFPVLSEGPHKLTLAAGIKYNGMSGTRGPYPFYEPKIITEYEFVAGVTDTINPSVKYYSTTFFAWSENFETNSISLHPTAASDTSLTLLNYDPPDPVYGFASGIGYMDDNRPILEVSTGDSDHPGYDLPKAGQYVFLEMDYNTNVPAVVGLFMREVGVQIIQHPVLVLNPTNGLWKKIYINFTPTVSTYYNTTYFNVFIRAEKTSSVDLAVIKVDNLKLIHRSGVYE